MKVTTRRALLLALVVALSLTMTACEAPSTEPAPRDLLLVDFPILGRPERSSDAPPAAEVESLEKIIVAQEESFTTWRWLRSTPAGDVYLVRTSEDRVCIVQYSPDTGHASTACPERVAGSLEPWSTVTVATDPLDGSKQSQLLAVAPARASHIEVRIAGRTPLRCAFSNNVAVLAAPPTEKFTVLVVDSTGKEMSELSSAMLPEDKTTDTTHCS